MTTMTCSPDAVLDVALADQLATRLCHDLAGLSGTLVGVLELATEDPNSVAEALPLAHEMANALIARLRLLRAAWGATGETLDASGLAQLGQGLPGAPRIALDVSGLPPGLLLPPPLARVVLNALLLGVEALPGGGTLSLASDEDGLVLRIAGRRPAWPDNLIELLEEPLRAGTALRECGPRRLQAPLLMVLAEATGIRLRLIAGGGQWPASLHIRVEAPAADATGS